MAKSGQNISDERLLYVEGVNDQWVIISLKEQYGHKEDDVKFKGMGNFDKAIDAFSMTLSNPKVTKRLGLIVDADSDISAARKKVISEFKRNGINITEKDMIAADGFIKDVTNTSGAVLRVGVWIMPDNINTGRLEDFLFKKIDPKDDLFIQVDPALVNLENTAKANPKVAGKMYTPIHRDKAKLHTYIAWSSHPDVSMGVAVQANLFPIESNEETLFKAWFENLFYN